MRTPEFLIRVGKVFETIGEPDRARQEFEKALKAAEEADRKDLQAQALEYLGNLHFRQGDFPQALSLLQRALDLYTETDDLEGIAWTYLDIGAVYLGQPDPDKAEEYFRKAQTVAHQAKERGVLATVANNLGVLALIREDEEEALVQLERAASLYEEIGDQTGLSWAHLNLGKLYIRKQDWEKAGHHLWKAYEISEDLGDIGNIALVHLARAEAYHILYDDLAAKAYADLAFRMAQQVKNPLVIADYYKLMGMIHARRGALDEAEAMFAESERIAREVKFDLGLAEALFEHGKALASAGKKRKARKFLEEARTLFRSFKARKTLAEIDKLLES